MQSDPSLRSQTSQGAILAAIDASTNTTSKKRPLEERVAEKQALEKRMKKYVGEANYIPVYPTVVSLLEEESVAAQDAKDYEAEKILSAALLKMVPSHAGALLMYCNAQMNLGNHAKALEKMEVGLRLKPNNVDMLVTHGLILSELDRYEEALISYDAALKIYPEASILANKALALIKLERYGQALENSTEALAKQPICFKSTWNCFILFR